MKKSFSKQVIEMLDNIEKASKDGDTEITIARIQQLLAYFYMYLQELKTRPINQAKLNKAVQEHLGPFMDEKK